MQQFSYSAGAERLDQFDSSWSYGSPGVPGTPPDWTHRRLHDRRAHGGLVRSRERRPDGNGAAGPCGRCRGHCRHQPDERGDGLRDVARLRIHVASDRRPDGRPELQCRLQHAVHEVRDRRAAPRRGRVGDQPGRLARNRRRLVAGSRLLRHVPRDEARGRHHVGHDQPAFQPVRERQPLAHRPSLVHGRLCGAGREHRAARHGQRVGRTRRRDLTAVRRPAAHAAGRHRHRLPRAGDHGHDRDHRDAGPRRGTASADPVREVRDSPDRVRRPAVDDGGCQRRAGVHWRRGPLHAPGGEWLCARAGARRSRRADLCEQPGSRTNRPARQPRRAEPAFLLREPRLDRRCGRADGSRRAA